MCRQPPTAVERHTGFWSEKSYGWHHDLMFILMNLVITCTDGSAYAVVDSQSVFPCVW